MDSKKPGGTGMEFSDGPREASRQNSIEKILNDVIIPPLDNSPKMSYPHAATAGILYAVAVLVAILCGHEVVCVEYQTQRHLFDLYLIFASFQLGGLHCVQMVLIM